MTDKERFLNEVKEVKLIIQANRAQGAFSEGYLIGQESVLEHFEKFIDSMQEDSEDDWKYSIAERLGVSKDEFDKMKPVSDDLEQAAKNCNANLQLQEYFKRGAQWQKNKQHQEPASKDLEQAAKEYADEQSVQAGIQSAFIAGSNWQKQQMKAYVINLNRRTLEYIYDVCKGVMPSKELFIKCVMGTIKED